MRRVAALVATLSIVAAPLAASAQGRPRRPGPPPPSAMLDPRPSFRDAGDLRGRFGVVVAERLLASEDPETRLRGLRRASSVATAQAIDALVRSQEPGRATSRDVRARLEAVRGLAAHATEDGPRQVLYRAIQDAAASQASEEPELLPLLRDTAAMALARAGDDAAVEQLAGLVRQGGLAGQSAQAALVAYPPRSIGALLGARAPLSTAVATLLADVGDVRGIPYLKRCVREAEASVRVTCLVSLARLGDAEGTLVARAWAGVRDPVARLGAARALAYASPVEGRKIVAALLGDAGTRDEALAIAASSPGLELVPTLVKLVGDESVDVATRREGVGVLGRSGGEAAANELARLLGAEDLAAEAALALALSPDRAARAVIERALGAPATRAFATRAGAVRAVVLGDRPSRLADVAEGLLRGEPRDRAAGAFALVAIGKCRPDDVRLLRDDDVVGAVARGALASGRTGLLIDELAATGNDALRRDAYGVALLAAPDGGPASTATLLAWVDEGSAIAPLAIRAVAARDEEGTRSRVASLLASGDVVTRTHVALGLARSPRADAAGRLATAYRFEPEASVRRAIVRSLAARSEPIRRETLELAAALDPDGEVRAVARSALAGRALGHDEKREVAWVVVDGGPARPALRVERGDGVVFPVVADPDRSLVVPGLAASGARVTFGPSSP